MLANMVISKLSTSQIDCSIFSNLFII